MGFSYHLVKYTRQAIEEAKKATEEVKKQMTLGKEHYTGDQQVISRLEWNLSELAPMQEVVLDMVAKFVY